MYRASESHKKRDVKMALKVKGGLYIPSFSAIDPANIIQADKDIITALLNKVLVVNKPFVAPNFDARYETIFNNYKAHIGQTIQTVSGVKKILGIVKDSKGSSRIVVEDKVSNQAATLEGDELAGEAFRNLFAEPSKTRYTTNLIVGKGNEPESPIMLSLLRLESVNEKVDQESSFERQ